MEAVIYDLELSLRLNSTKSSRATSRDRCLYDTGVSRIFSVIIQIPDDDGNDLRNVGFIQTPDAADSPRRLRGMEAVSLSERMINTFSNTWRINIRTHTLFSLRLLLQCAAQKRARDGKCTLKVRGVFAQGWRSP